MVNIVRYSVNILLDRLPPPRRVDGGSRRLPHTIGPPSPRRTAMHVARRRLGLAHPLPIAAQASRGRRHCSGIMCLMPPSPLMKPLIVAVWGRFYGRFGA